MRRNAIGWLLAGSIASLGAGPCFAAAATAPPTAEQLVNSGKVGAFLAGARGSYVLRNSSVLTNFNEATSMGSFADPVEPSGWLIHGSRHHSADERGGLLVGADRQVRAVGLIHFDGYGFARGIRVPKGAAGCLSRPMLSVFLRHSPSAARDLRQMRSWAARENADMPADTRSAGEMAYKVVWLSPGKSARRR